MQNGRFAPALLALLAAAAPPRFSEHLISRDFTYPYGVALYDVDGDGDLDVTASDARAHNNLYWFENGGKGGWTRHVIHHQPMSGWRLERHAVGDFNRDGRPDIVIVENSMGDLRWLENPGPEKIRSPWPVHFITRADAVPGAYDVAVADFDGDGDLDVAASSWNRGNMFTWHENPGDPTQLWKQHRIAGNLGETRTVRVADFDGDGRPDVLGTASGDGLVLWFQNPGPGGGEWRAQVIDTALRPSHGEAADMDGDGDPDVVMTFGMAAEYSRLQPVASRIVWYENLGKGAAWKRHVVEEPFPNAFDVVAADLDGDGDLDLAATAWNKDAGVALAWFENLGRGQWRRHVLKENWPRAVQLVVGDLNGDRRPDIVAGAEDGSMDLRWWRNEGGGR